MPLASLLDRLGGLLSKYFIVGQFFPALIFGFLNAAILYGYSPWFRRWSPTLTSVTTAPILTQAFDGVVVLIGISVVGYLLSCVNSYLREVLEGKHFPARLEWLKQRMMQTQRRKYTFIQQEYQRARVEASRIADSRQKWIGDMVAGIQQSHTDENTYTGMTEDAGRQIESLRHIRQSAEPIPFSALESAVAAMSLELARHNIRKPTASGSNRLSEDRRELVTLIDYARDAWSSRELQMFKQGTGFGLASLAPTALGNVATSMQAYGITRYHINLETFWPRLQPIIASANKDFYLGLLDSRTQLDFLVACCWLSAISTAIWVPILVFSGGPWWLFLIVATAGYFATWLCYELAVRNYVVFTELVRASVDLYRFQLLQALHIAVPGGIRDERAAWAALQSLSTYGQPVDLSYQNDAKGGAS